MVLVTGGTGFIGAYIIKELISKGYSVRALRRGLSVPNFIDASILNQVQWVEGDILDVVSLEEAMNGVDYVIHAAGKISCAASQHAKGDCRHLSGSLQQNGQGPRFPGTGAQDKPGPRRATRRGSRETREDAGPDIAAGAGIHRRVDEEAGHPPLTIEVDGQPDICRLAIRSNWKDSSDHA